MAERKFRIEIYRDDYPDVITDYYNLENVNSPQGLGFKLKLSTIATDYYNYVYDKKIDSDNITFICEFEEPNAYQKADNFRSWILKNIDKTMTLKYDDINEIKYIDFHFVNFSQTEISITNSIAIDVKPLSPFYKKTKKTLQLTSGQVNLNYTYTYPYAYGGKINTNNTLTNSFFKQVPLVLKLNGKWTNPQIALIQDDVVYARVNLPNFVIKANQSLYIDAEKQKIYNSSGVDCYEYVNEDESFRTFLFLKSGTSTIAIGCGESESVNLTIYFKEMVL